MKKPIKCKECGGPHYQTWCYYRLKKQPKSRNTIIKPHSQRRTEKQVKDAEFKLQWIQDNANSEGVWPCYLRISPMCIPILTVETLTIEHVIPKGRGEKYRYDPTNIKPSCAMCNALKGSRTLESLSKQYPHLKQYIV